MTTTLAISDTWTVTMFVVNLVVGVIVTVVGILVTILLSREKQREARMSLLEHNLEQRAEDLIESKLTGVATHLEGVINVVNERVSNVRERLAAGDASFADLDKRDRELQARFDLRFDQLKDFLHKTFATKDEAAALHRRIDAVKHLKTGGCS